MDKLDTLTTLGTQDTGRITVRENRRGQSRMDNPETQATLGTQDRGCRQIKHNTTQKTKKLRNTDLHKNSA